MNIYEVYVIADPERRLRRSGSAFNNHLHEPPTEAYTIRMSP